MDAQATEVFFGFFAALPDPRRHNIRHLFTDIFTIAVFAVMSKADDWSEVVLYAKSRVAWLSTLLALPNGIPCEDTFRRVFARIDPDAFERCFTAWTAGLAAATAGGPPDGRIIPFDGKVMRQSFEHAWDKQGLHLVSAWCERNQMVLGQLAVEEKSNEITAIPRLLAMINIKKAVVTIDAMGCQRGIAGQIVAQGGDYVLAVKDNQPTLHDKVRNLMDEAALDKFKGMSHGHDKQTNKGHGRIEAREMWVTNEVNWLGAELLALWPGLSSLAMVESTRQNLGDLTGKVSVERRYYISSLTGVDAAKMAAAVRSHWAIENKLHWRLDMAFGEDESRIRKGHGPDNFSRLRRIVLNKLREAPEKPGPEKGTPTPKGRKISLKGKRYLCSLDPDYLIKQLQQ